jgi:hypothetical protein
LLIWLCEPKCLVQYPRNGKKEVLHLLGHLFEGKALATARPSKPQCGRTGSVDLSVNKCIYDGVGWYI